MFATGRLAACPIVHYSTRKSLRVRTGNSKLNAVTTSSFLLTWWGPKRDLHFGRDLHLGRLLQGAFVVGHELLNSFCSEFMADVEALPRLAQIERLIGNWLQEIARLVVALVGEIVSRQRKRLGSPFFPDLRGSGGEFGMQGKCAKQVVQVANACGQHEDVAVPCREHLFDIRYEVYAVLAAIV